MDLFYKLVQCRDRNQPRAVLFLCESLGFQLVEHIGYIQAHSGLSPYKLHDLF